MTTKESTQPDNETMKAMRPSPSPDCALTTPDMHRLTLWWSPSSFEKTEEGTRLSGAHKTCPRRGRPCMQKTRPQRARPVISRDGRHLGDDQYRGSTP